MEFKEFKEDYLKTTIPENKDLAKNLHSYLLLAETFLLQAKLQLLTFDLKAAKSLLTQALHICKKYGLTGLAVQITKNQDELANQLNKWEESKKI